MVYSTLDDETSSSRRGIGVKRETSVLMKTGSNTHTHTQVNNQHKSKIHPPTETRTNNHDTITATPRPPPPEERGVRLVVINRKLNLQNKEKEKCDF